jgi:hypothetical protein
MVKGKIMKAIEKIEKKMDDMENKRVKLINTSCFDDTLNAIIIDKIELLQWVLSALEKEDKIYVDNNK